MKKKVSLALTINLIVIASSVTFILTYLFGLENYGKKGKKYDELQALDSYVRQNFYGDINENELNDGILKGYVSGLNDRYSRYLSADEYADEKSENAGEMTGLGFTLKKNENGYIRVAEVMPDSPVSETDIRPDDLIVAVNGKDVIKTGFEESIDAMTATEQITFTVRRDNTDKDYTLTRRHIDVTTVMGEMLENHVGYIKISGFKENTPEQFEETFEKLKKDGAKGILFDVRENGGGLLTSLEKCLDPLLPEGIIATAEYSDGHTENIVESDKEETNLPVVVLVNEHTASAAELFAASLRDFGKAELVGVQTYGKGVMQTTTEFTNGGAVVLTIAEYKTSVSECYDGVGLTPDYIVENEDTDEQYNKAVELINSKIN
ncbi:MAG: PDZ domain-containing protein [Ruminococcus sp.]|nr:PDZ domain-containing protein [Ruminococcus sp.]